MSEKIIKNSHQNEPATLSVRPKHRVQARWKSSRDQEGYKVSVELPGVEREAVRLRQEGREIFLEADRRGLDKDHHLISGSAPPEGYRLRLKVPDEVDPEKFSANLNMGVLRLVLPMRTENLPREIPLN